LDEQGLADLVEFARIEVAACDVEPWAEILRTLREMDRLTFEEAAWLVKLYNAYDSLGSAWEAFRRWPGPLEWDASESRNDARWLPCTQERRGLRGGRVLQHLQSYVDHLVLTSRGTQEEWLRQPVDANGPGSPATAFELPAHIGWWALMEQMRSVWGVGRQTAFEWAEFVQKVLAFPIDAPDGALWESSGPRGSIERLYRQTAHNPQWLNEKADELRKHLAEQGVQLSIVDFETVICDFDVMRKGRYYPGRHLAALREEIETEAVEHFGDRQLLMDAWDRFVPEPWRDIKPGIDSSKMPHYKRTGEIISTPY
jgi:hypothetical protein